jgi:hypothetical protein
MTGNPRGSGYEKAEGNWYQEGPKAIEALLDAEPFEGTVWDPCCGEGNIPKACASRGMTTYATDLVDRGYGGQLDFLKVDAETGPLTDNAIFNPPFDLIEPFIHQALRLASRKVAVIGRIAFLEGSKRRQTLFDGCTPLARVWVFSSRISMPPGGQSIEPKGGSIAFCWYVWEHEHRGLPTLGWLP